MRIFKRTFCSAFIRNLRNRLFIVLSLLLFSCDQNNLFESETFIIKTDRVLQGPFEAIAHSPNRLASNYRSDYRMPTKREVFFKFSLNGKDNERSPGEDHRLFIDGDDGTLVSEIYTFGKPDPQMDLMAKPQRDNYLGEDVSVTFRCDMRHVLDSFEKNGYFETATGDRIEKNNFQGLYIAGNMLPLTWEFTSLTDNPSSKMTDPDKNGIYEIALKFSQFQQEAEQHPKNRMWNSDSDLSGFPALNAPHVIIEALYNLALEELELNIREDGSFMAGKKWPGIWTRDISYSILLSLAALLPEESKNSLMAKVDKNRIIQDTGTGGSWPVSTDRMTWSLAAWEIYTVTGDTSWLKYAYQIIRNSAEADLLTVFDPKSGLFYGESSFLDWREQTYPRWMEPKDIYHSFSLGTNAVHYQSYRILSRMAQQLENNSQKYSKIADGLKSAINQDMWLNDPGYYGQYLYGRNFLTLSERAETLGAALCMLFDIADPNQKKSILSHLPLTEFGPTCIFPHIPDIPPYHNNGIWPFVIAYWTWAAAAAQNSAAVEHGMASIIRPAALFLTNKENFVASTGDYLGTEINSDRQLWSVAGYLAMIYRVLFGISFEQNELSFTPFIPKKYGGTWILSHFRYRQADLQITIEGYGSIINEFFLDGTQTDRTRLPSDLQGNHSVLIRMANNTAPSGTLNMGENIFSPITPHAVLQNDRLEWQKHENDRHYIVYKNGKKIHKTTATHFEIEEDDHLNEYQVQIVDKNNYCSFLSEPVQLLNKSRLHCVEIEKGQPGRQNNYSGYTGDGYLKLTRTENTILNIPLEISEIDYYVIDFRYANGSGPVNTNNKCGIRSFYVDGARQGTFVFPQRGIDKWTDWGYSNPIHVALSPGVHLFQLIFEGSNENMNGQENSVLLDYLRLMRINIPEQFN